MNQVQNKLREYRKRAGMRQLDVAKTIGFTSTERISKWERGLTYPHVINLHKIARLFGVTMDELYPDLKHVSESNIM